MSEKAVVLIDMDGVLCEWVPKVLDEYKARYPDYPCPRESEITEFYLEKAWSKEFEHVEALRKVLNTPGLYRDLDPVPGARSAMAELESVCRMGAYIDPFICSSPWTHAEDLCCHSDKMRWVKDNLGEWWVDRVILTKDKTLIRGHFLIDDKPEIKGALTPVWQQLLYDRSWNRSVPESTTRFTWADWPQLLNILLGRS